MPLESVCQKQSCHSTPVPNTSDLQQLNLVGQQKPKNTQSCTGHGNAHGVIWDDPLYTVNMSYNHWLIKNLIWPTATQYSEVGNPSKNIGKKKAESERCQQSLEEKMSEQC